jgi:hypothetical protein
MTPTLDAGCMNISRYFVDPSHMTTTTKQSGMCTRTKKLVPGSLCSLKKAATPLNSVAVWLDSLFWFENHVGLSCLTSVKMGRRESMAPHHPSRGINVHNSIHARVSPDAKQETSRALQAAVSLLMVEL